MSRIVEFTSYGEPDVLKFKEIPDPQPGANEIAIRVKAIGLNRAESMWRHGEYIEPVKLPARLGYEAARTVAALGEGVGGFKIGEPVDVILQFIDERICANSERSSPSSEQAQSAFLRSTAHQQESVMTGYTHQTAPTQYVDANGIRFAYRMFGKNEGLPLLFNQHYTGTMDHWDPAVTDGFAKDRPVILFNNAGVSTSSGEVPASFEEMGANAIAFVKALGLAKLDVLGFSIGGFVAQEIVLQEPDLVRRLILLGTGPRGGEGMEGGTPEGNRIFSSTYEDPDTLWLSVFFTPSPASQAAGREFLKRFRLRTKDRDPEVNAKVATAQRTAIGKWSMRREHSYDYLKAIKQPTLVVNGSTDPIIYPINSFILQQNLPNAKLIVYPDSAHGGHHQYPDMFVRDVSLFLSGDDPWA